MDSKYIDSSITFTEREYLPREAMAAAGWGMATDPSVGQRKIVSMSKAKANGLFATEHKTVLLGVHWKEMPVANNKRKRGDDTPTKETKGYGVYMTPAHKEHFFVWHTMSIEEWVTENQGQGMPVYVDVTLVETNKNNFYDVVFTPMKPAAKEILYEHFVTPQERELYDMHTRGWLPPVASD